MFANFHNPWGEGGLVVWIDWESGERAGKSVVFVTCKTTSLNAKV
jgi:hypothetical protein